MSHSKRNTSRPVFTSHERAVAKSNWVSSSARLNRDSFLPFGCCGLCMSVARDPVSCVGGDIFCRECALTNILAQKKEIKRTEKANRFAKQEAEHAKTVENDEDRRRAIRDFELTQAGLPADEKPRGSRVVGKGKALDVVGKDDSTDVVTKDGTKVLTAQVEQPKADAAEHNALVRAVSKRKFILDDNEINAAMMEDKRKARKAIEEEKAAKPTLPSFWTPSLTPDVHDSKLPPVVSKEKTVPICPSSSDDNLHPISMQSLISVQFHEDTIPSNEEKSRACPSCLKTLSNASNPVMTERCGHVLCMSCVKMLVLPAAKSTSRSETPATCFVCDAPIASASATKTSVGLLPPGLVALKSQGTGFSARGSNTVVKSSTAFQC
ncbi:hypothetical protein L249_7930 [Ophiocordyceps polyrhachis-furcata BCC 54312]|uniref:RING-type domain-containing protein n=1 Tax=Ophiocordyceps polyrhachis-furcata BCC 54312 TaxID=1330021 RepID=A0A367LI37_9HYPO|nr:hypothetical protein L249_7930 [Ophiocordyceps polyrhachis-furcata BCC 54312]